MNPLARAHQRRMAGLVHRHHPVDKDAGGIDHGSRTDPIPAAGLAVGHPDTANAPLFIVHNLFDRSMIQQAAAMLGTGLRQVDGHARIIELAVVINDTALQSALDGHRQTTGRLRGRNET